MLKFKAQTSEGELYGFGLTQENMAALLMGRPIAIDLAAMDGPPLTVFLLYGETEQSITDALVADGLIDPAVTKISACQCAKCVAKRAANGEDADEDEDEDEDERVFHGAVRIDPETGAETSFGFEAMEAAMVPALAAGFVVGWLRMGRNAERLAELQFLLRNAADESDVRARLIKHYTLGYRADVGGARTLADEGYAMELADWDRVSEALADMDAGREPRLGRRSGRGERGAP